MNTDLKDKCVLITGASGGIGLATARMFADEGARLVLHYHSNRASLDALAGELTVPHLLVQADLREEQQVDAMYAAAIDAFGMLDVVVANAGIFPEPPTPLWEMSADRWHGTMAADLDSVFFTCRGFLRHLADKPHDAASIVLIGSTSALFGEAGHADYSAAKSAMTYGLMRTLKNEIVKLSPRGRVNCVCPGWTRTPMAEEGLKNDAAVRRVHSTIPMKKIAEPEDVAGAILYFASERLSGHVSGAIIPVAGGMEGRLLNSELL